MKIEIMPDNRVQMCCNGAAAEIRFTSSGIEIITKEPAKIVRPKEPPVPSMTANEFYNELVRRMRDNDGVYDKLNKLVIQREVFEDMPFYDLNLLKLNIFGNVKLDVVQEAYVRSIFYKKPIDDFINF